MRYWNTLRNQPRPARFLMGRILWRTGLCTWLRFRHNGSVLRFHPSSFSAALWMDPGQTRDDETFFESYVRPGDVVVDVGANIGVLSLLASRLTGGQGEVIAIEPHPATFRYLQYNLSLNQASNIIAHRVAVGETNGSIIFSDKRMDDQNQVLSEGEGIVVPARTLDSVLASVPRVNLLKIDVEGYERAVLRGAGDTLRRAEAIYFEAWQQHFRRFHYGFAEIWDLLANRGFEVFRFSGPGLVARVQRSYCPEICENLVAMRDLSGFLQRTHYEVEESAA